MRFANHLALLCVLTLSGCGEPEESFDNLPDCVDDHAALGQSEAIAHCLVDFPDLHPDLADQAACVEWVEANGGYTESSDDACADYFEEVDAG